MELHLQGNEIPNEGVLRDQVMDSSEELGSESCLVVKDWWPERRKKKKKGRREWGESICCCEEEGGIGCWDFP